MNTKEELNLLSSYLLPSHSNKYFTIDFDQLSNDQIKIVLSDWLPNQIIKIGPYCFYYLRKDISPELWSEDFIDNLSFFASEIACRDALPIDYLNQKMNKANLLILCFTKDQYLEDDFQQDLLNGIFISNYNSKEHSGFIYATCFKEIPDVRIKLGLFMRCMGLSLMKNLDVKHVYTQALNEALVKYYSTLGFKIMNDTPKSYVKCDQQEEIDEIYQENDNDIDRVMAYMKKRFYPKKVKKWYMAICNFDEKKICYTAFDSIRKEIQKIPPTKSILLSNYNTVKRWKGTKWRELKFDSDWEEFFLKEAKQEDVVDYLNSK